MGRPSRVDRLWAGLTAVLIGGGPSLTLEQIQMIAKSRLSASGVRVIAVNNAVYVAWWADWLHGCDSKWWIEHIQQVQHFPGIRTTLDPLVPERWKVGLLNNTGQTGFDPDPANCRTGSNGIYQAIHCCIHAGVKQIILAGVDMKRAPDGRSHWHGGHGLSAPDYQTVMAPHFETLVPELRERRISVVNASPGTALTTFPVVSLDAVLPGVLR